MVGAWLERVGRGASSDELRQQFEAAFAALWQRARVTLGDSTLTAIASRVVETARERYPELAGLEVDLHGVRLVADEPPAPDQPLADGLVFVLAEFLGVLGRLTADILTPALRAALANVPVVRTSARAEPGAGDGPPPRKPGKEVVS